MADLEDMTQSDRRVWYASAVAEAARQDAQRARAADSPGYCVRCHQPLTMTTFRIFDGHCPRCAYLATFYPAQYDNTRGLR